MWVVYGLLSAIFAALVAIFGRLGVSKVDTTLATAVRSVIMAAFLVGVAISLNKEKLLPSISGSALGYIILSGIAGALSWLFYFVALKQSPTTSAVAALDRLSVVFVFVLATLFLSETFSWKVAIGAVLVAVGAFLMV